MPGGLRDEFAGAVCPLHEHDGAPCKVVLPSYGKDIFRRAQAIQIHVHKKESLRRMLRHKTERRAGHGALDAKCLAHALGEGGLAGAKIAFKADDISRRELCGKLLRDMPRFLDGLDGILFLHGLKV